MVDPNKGPADIIPEKIMGEVKAVLERNGPALANAISNCAKIIAAEILEGYAIVIEKAPIEIYIKREQTTAQAAYCEAARIAREMAAQLRTEYEG
jgi:hypothetical protein